MDKSEAEFKEILKELYKAGERIEELRLQLYRNKFYRNETLDKGYPEVFEEIDNLLFRIQCDTKFKVATELSEWMGYIDD